MVNNKQWENWVPLAVRFGRFDTGFMDESDHVEAGALDRVLELCLADLHWVESDGRP